MRICSRTAVAEALVCMWVQRMLGERACDGAAAAVLHAAGMCCAIESGWTGRLTAWLCKRASEDFGYVLQVQANRIIMFASPYCRWFSSALVQTPMMQCCMMQSEKQLRDRLSNQRIHD